MQAQTRYAPALTSNKIGASCRVFVRTGPTSLLVVIFSCTALAQSGAGGHPAPRPNPPPPPVRPQDATFDQRRKQMESNSIRLPQSADQRDTCFLPPLNGIQLPTVGVSTLQIPSKAKK